MNTFVTEIVSKFLMSLFPDLLDPLILTFIVFLKCKLVYNQLYRACLNTGCMSKMHSCKLNFPHHAIELEYKQITS